MNARSRSEAESLQETPAEAGLTVILLSAIEESCMVTQRSLARRLGIALGLTNAYLGRCINKGLVKVSQAPANRYKYYLTPKGFAEKSRLTAKYLSYSFDFIRKARAEYADIVRACEERRWRTVLLCGRGELAEVAILSAEGTDVTIAGIVDPASERNRLGRFRVVKNLTDIAGVDAAIVTDQETPQATFDRLIQQISEERVLTPPLLHISRKLPLFFD
jgi:DNA-binding MarR family transcriptional regulator